MLAGDIRNLEDLPSGGLDMYMSLGVFEHFEHGMQEVLLEAHRLLAAGGVIAVSVPYMNLLRRHISSYHEKRQGGIFHLTHRCHDCASLLKFARDRRASGEDHAG